MEHPKFYQFINDTIQEYRRMLFEDFKQSPNFERLASAMCYHKPGVKDWIEGLQIECFERIIPLKEYKVEGLRFSDIDRIDHDYLYLKPEEYNLYSFFTKYTYNSLEELRTDDNRYFYLCQDDCVNKLDNLFIDNIVGYSKTGRDNFTRSLSAGFKLKIDLKKYRKHFETAEDYSYPTVYLEFENEKYFFASEMDSFTLLLMGKASFTIFFHGNLTLLKRTGEPVIYYNEIDGTYTLTNSYENLQRFNKFIFLNTELYIHYFKVFEKWVEDVFIPKILEGETIGK